MPSIFRFLLLTAGVSLSGTLFSQQHNDLAIKAAQAQAIGINDVSLFDQLLVYVPGVGSPGRQALQQQDLKPYFLPVRQLGFRGSEWAYALAACLEYYVNLNRNFKDNLSPDYLALSVQASGQRPSLDVGLRQLTTSGTVSAAVVPFDAAALPSASLTQPPYRIANFLHIIQPQQSPREKIYELRKAVIRGNPVVVDLLTDASFPTLQGVEQWQPTGPASQLHALVVVGFDATRELIELRSSFGKEWGDGGYVWMSYQDFTQYVQGGYAFVPLFI